MKKTYLFLFIVFAFIVSCNKQPTSPSISSEIIDGITYYDPAYAETKEYSFIQSDLSIGKDLIIKNIFKKAAESQNVIFYLENGHNKTKEELVDFLKKFEEYYAKETYIYGTPSDIDGNGKIIFLMASLNTNNKPGDSITGGYFFPYDLYEEKKGEYLYVDVTSPTDFVIGVMMHELQHLINNNMNVFNGKGEMDIWLNEALSESTSHLFSESLTKKRSDLFNSSAYYTFYSWYLSINDKEEQIFDGNLITLSYASSSMFMKWLNEKTGNQAEIYRTIAHSDTSLSSENRLVNSVVKHNSSLGSTMNDMLINWIKDINSGNIAEMTVSAINPDDPNFSKNGAIPLIPKALIVYDEASLANINDENIMKVSLGNGLATVLNTSVNIYPGVAASDKIVNLTLPKVSASLLRSSSIPYKTLDMNLVKANQFTGLGFIGKEKSMLK